MLSGTSWLLSQLPVPVKRWLIDLLFGLGGPMLQGSERYRRWRRMRLVPSARPEAMAPDVGDPAATLSELRLRTSLQPQLSIVITSYGNLGRVAACLRSIADHPPDIDFEVIVADDASGVPAMAALHDVSGLRFLPNETNLGYLRTVNRTSGLAGGEYLWLLNDDTLLTAGAANALLDALRDVPNCVAAGSRLLNPDGTVQEVGSIVWRDGTATNAGAGTDRLDATTRYMHEVDYCSAASLMLRTADFVAAGGYDERFSPAYYEDTDLAFKLRARGGRVVVQPASDVVHFGGGSYGSDASRQLLKLNRDRFLAKWATDLAGHCAVGTESFLPRDRAVGWGAVLIVCSDGVDHELIERLTAADFVTKLWIDDRTLAASLVDRMGAAGIETISANSDERLGRWLRQHRSALDFAVTGKQTPSWQEIIKRSAAAEFQAGGAHVARFGDVDANMRQRLMTALVGGATGRARQI